MPYLQCKLLWKRAGSKIDMNYKKKKVENVTFYNENY